MHIKPLSFGAYYFWVTCAHKFTIFQLDLNNILLLFHDDNYYSNEILWRFRWTVTCSSVTLLKYPKGRSTTPRWACGFRSKRNGWTWTKNLCMSNALQKWQELSPRQTRRVCGCVSYPIRPYHRRGTFLILVNKYHYYLFCLFSFAIIPLSKRLNFKGRF